MSPKSKAELQVAIKECLQLSTDCSKGPHEPIGSWDVSSVIDMSKLLSQHAIPEAATFSGDMSKWDVSRVTLMEAMFADASIFKGDISQWDVSKVVSMRAMFYYAPSFNGDVSKWDVSRVTNMAGMFYHAASFNGDISRWDVSRVNNMLRMFYHAVSFNADLSKWDVSRVTNMVEIFSGTASFTQTLCGAWSTSKADKDRMFDGSSGKMCTTTSTTSAYSKATCMQTLKPDSDKTLVLTVT